MPYVSKKIILPVIIFFMAIASLFYVTSGQKGEIKYNVPENTPPSASDTALPLETSAPKNGVKIIEDKGEHTSVRYANRIFSPASVTIESSKGCFVEIQNTSDEIVIPRLGPHTVGKETGVLYPAIAPHASSLIDPRYGTTNQFSFYNKNNPSAVFSVQIDPSCL